MKPIMATAIAPTAAATATAPAPKKTSRRSREGAMVRTMIRTIKADFDQSRELSVLISRHIDQQRWAHNMAVKEKLDDPRVTEV